jgi:hypothetical protein
MPESHCIWPLCAQFRLYFTQMFQCLKNLDHNVSALAFPPALFIGPDLKFSNYWIHFECSLNASKNSLSSFCPDLYPIASPNPDKDGQ